MGRSIEWNQIKRHDMKVVVQHLETHLYWAAGGTWVADYRNARHFPNAAAAILEFRALKEPVRIVYKFEDSSYDIELITLNRPDHTEKPTLDSSLRENHHHDPQNGSANPPSQSAS